MTRLARRQDDGFTLVELLVVIGIIAILIAILMPALSRAQTQALQVACASNERQVVMGALAYANDWKRQLPTMIGPATSNQLPCCPGTFALDLYGRLPIVGFDTITVVIDPFNDFPSWGGPCVGQPVGGWAFMLRDYLANDREIVVCPSGFSSSEKIFQKDCWGVRADANANTGVGYLWLPHRANREGTVIGGIRPQADGRKDIARTSRAKPRLLITVDFNLGVLDDAPPTQAMAANHSGADIQDQAVSSWPLFDPSNAFATDPDDLPLGINRARVDGVVAWQPFQDVEYLRYSGQSSPPADQYYMW